MYINRVDYTGQYDKKARFTASAWVQNQLKPTALLGTAFMDPYNIDILTSQKQLHYNALDDFFIPFDIQHAGKQVVYKVSAGRDTIVPAGMTYLVPAIQKEIPKDCSFAFYRSIGSAIDTIINHKLPPRVVIVNNTEKDIKIYC